jgi:hypothetical protein
MHFFKKLFGLVSNSRDKDEKNDYARATFEYATSPRISKSNAIVYSNQGLTYEANSAYLRAIPDYSRTFEINTNKAKALIDVGFFDLQGKRISVTFYRSFTSTIYRLSSTQKLL